MNSTDPIYSTTVTYCSERTILPYSLPDAVPRLTSPHLISPHQILSDEQTMSVRASQLSSAQLSSAQLSSAHASETAECSVPFDVPLEISSRHRRRHGIEGIFEVRTVDRGHVCGLHTAQVTCRPNLKER